MPRIGESRAPAEPSSKLQHEKYARMLKSAEELASQHRFDHVQMHDVAKSAGIAIGTLYRYFPSKTQLFVSVMAAQIEGLTAQSIRAIREDLPPWESVASILTQALRSLMARPMLADAMIRSLNIAHVDRVVDVAKIDEGFKEALWAAARISVPTEEDDRLARLVNQQWFGMVQSCLNGHISVETAEADLRLACELLLADLTSSRRWRELPGGGRSRDRVATEHSSGIRSKNS
ncbi:TetR family transcriptional regulator [Tomitella biformata]|uniref:TetR family transcriptional regulator n=1 Tax=Tomitella biformata TaxID=630403 RepID=UPI000465A8DE|nr:TetR family transcriptional regulator [Tomitella biformata]